MNIIQEKKIIKLLEKIVEQNQQIIDNMHYKGLGYPRYLDERFTGPVPHDKWQPYKGPDCGNTNTTNFDPSIKAYNNREVTPVYHTSYDGTKTTLPVTMSVNKWSASKKVDPSSLPDREWYG